VLKVLLVDPIASRGALRALDELDCADGEPLRVALVAGVGRAVTGGDRASRSRTAGTSVGSTGRD